MYALISEESINSLSTHSFNSSFSEENYLLYEKKPTPFYDSMILQSYEIQMY